MRPKENSSSFWLASTKSARWFYVLLSGLCFWLAFPPYDQVYLLFVALVPLLLIEDELFYTDSAHRSRNTWWWSSAAFLLFNILATWWVKNAAWVGAIAGIIANTLFMTTAFFLFHVVKKRGGARMGFMGLVSLWIGMEFLHLNWDFDFPWLILGNAFANTPWLVQWYSITGVFGGSLWVLLINILMFQGIQQLLLRQRQSDSDERRVHGLQAFRALFRASVLLLIPSLWSLYTYNTYEAQGPTAEVAVIQPNFDPYGTKFNSGTYQMQLDSLLLLTDQAMSPNTRMVFWPETSIPDYVRITDDIDRNWQIQQIRHTLSNYEGPSILAGASVLTIYPANTLAPEGSRSFSDGSHYTSHNSALFISNYAPTGLYHKSKLVIGVEKMPYPKLFKFLDIFSLDLGGMSGQLTKQKERASFQQGNVKAAPVICYESIFGGFVTGYVREKGANLLAVLTNDGWWGDTDGYRQHMAYARLRAIENRRDVVRAANTGLSCFINQRGDVTGQTDWWVAASLTQEVRLNAEMSFYTKYGDYLGRTAAFLAVLLYLIAFSKSRSAKKRML